MPTLRQLQYLVAIADERHFGRAAQRVHVAQPTLSAQFSALEQKLSCRLVERDRKGVTPTPVGREVIERARKVLSEVQGIVDFVETSRSELSGKLKLGVPPTLGPYLLAHIVPVLHQRFPQLKLYVREGTPRDIQDELIQGTLDVVLTPAPVMHSSLEVRQLFKENLSVVCAPDHELLNQETITLDDLREQNVLTLEAGHHLHAQIRQICDAHGAKLLSDYEGTSLDTLRHMVGMGVGLSFFPELYIRSEMPTQAEVKVLKLDNADLSRDICMAWRPGHGLKENMEKIEGIIRDAYAALVERT